MGHFLQYHTTQQHCLLFVSLGHAQTHKHMCTHTSIKQYSGVILNDYNNKELIMTGEVSEGGEIHVPALRTLVFVGGE